MSSGDITYHLRGQILVYILPGLESGKNFGVLAVASSENHLLILAIFINYWSCADAGLYSRIEFPNGMTRFLKRIGRPVTSSNGQPRVIQNSQTAKTGNLLYSVREFSI